MAIPSIKLFSSEENTTLFKNMSYRSMDLEHMLKKFLPDATINLGLFQEKISLICNTKENWLRPAIQDENKNIFYALLKTVLAISLIAGAILSGFFIGSSACVGLGLVALAACVALYVMATEAFIFPERRIYKDDPPGFWFCPNIDTFQPNNTLDPTKLSYKTNLKGILIACSGILPIIGGLVLPLLEACTRKSRWEKVLETQYKQLDNYIPSLVDFYQKNGLDLVNWSQNPNMYTSEPEKDSKQIEFKRFIQSQIDILRIFHPDL